MDFISSKMWLTKSKDMFSNNSQVTPSWFRKVFKKRELLILIVTGESIIEKQNSEISPESFVKMKYFAWQSVFIDRTPIDEKKIISSVT